MVLGTIEINLMSAFCYQGTLFISMPSPLAPLPEGEGNLNIPKYLISLIFHPSTFGRGAGGEGLAKSIAWKLKLKSVVEKSEMTVITGSLSDA
jgi:hypothetical protein